MFQLLMTPYDFTSKTTLLKSHLTEILSALVLVDRCDQIRSNRLTDFLPFGFTSNFEECFIKAIENVYFVYLYRFIRE